MKTEKFVEYSAVCAVLFVGLEGDRHFDPVTILCIGDNFGWLNHIYYKDSKSNAVQTSIQASQDLPIWTIIQS